MRQLWVGVGRQCEGSSWSGKIKGRVPCGDRTKGSAGCVSLERTSCIKLSVLKAQVFGVCLGQSLHAGGVYNTCPAEPRLSNTGPKEELPRDWWMKPLALSGMTLGSLVQAGFCAVCECG